MPCLFAGCFAFGGPGHSLRDGSCAVLADGRLLVPAVPVPLADAGYGLDHV